MARVQLVREITKAIHQLGGEGSTREILKVIEKNYRWGATISSVSNLLARHRQFTKTGHIDTYIKADGYGPGYRVRETTWCMTMEVEA